MKFHFFCTLLWLFRRNLLLTFGIACWSGALKFILVLFAFLSSIICFLMIHDMASSPGYIIECRPKSRIWANDGSKYPNSQRSNLKSWTLISSFKQLFTLWSYQMLILKKEKEIYILLDVNGLFGHRVQKLLFKKMWKLWFKKCCWKTCFQCL